MAHTTSRGTKRLVVAGGSLLAVAGLITAAAFTDYANLNLGNGTDDGIGGENARFNIQVVGTDDAGVPVPGTWQEANTPEGVNIAVPGADLITPGDTISVDIPFRNESPALSADIAFSLQDRPGYVSDAQIAEALRYSVLVDGVAIVTDATQAVVADLDLGLYTSGQDGVLTVSITLPDQGSNDANNALQGQISYVQAHFDAASVQP
ncbi:MULTISPECIES: hypothetical protein [Microbacterium]|uniref:hypothetical protein n=1 Tax=Microbacterium TaxID=33882 RepID=UPI0007688DB1|nr:MULTISPECIES: hypothetical protein [Microbacterium]KXC06627.1 hypothetical protein MhomT_04270 [Microbacterium hominis]QOC24342.1 hypothetical protein IC745_07945 [Microbacterium hominis]QOC28427.1 hypothetical protein IC744_13700 [Microbacterium hominis]QYF96377.1 hypothetical protein KY498_09200 [Microbacterium sp. PAMC21962]